MAGRERAHTGTRECARNRLTDRRERFVTIPSAAQQTVVARVHMTHVRPHGQAEHFCIEAFRIGGSADSPRVPVAWVLGDGNRLGCWTGGIQVTTALRERDAVLRIDDALPLCVALPRPGAGVGVRLRQSDQATKTCSARALANPDASHTQECWRSHHNQSLAWQLQRSSGDAGRISGGPSGRRGE